MKRKTFLILLLSAAQYIYSAEYYESNALGMPLGKIAESNVSDFDFVLKIEKESDREIRTLFREGDIYFTRTIETADEVVTETTVKNKVTKIVTRKNGVIIREEKISENNVAETTEYFYKDDRLEYAEYRIDNELQYRDNYSYTNQNRLLDVKREYQQNDESDVSSFIFRKGKIAEFWSNLGRGQSYLSFNSDGLVFSEIVSEENQAETREYGRLENGNTFVIITDHATGNRLRTEYDSSGRPEYSVVFDPGNKKLEEEYYTYQSDRLVMLTVKKELSTEKYIYSYDADGAVTSEIYKKNDNIIYRKIFSDDENYIEILYRRGTPFMKITYREGERVNTEDYQEPADD
jgi:hypothetical protein